MTPTDVSVLTETLPGSRVGLTIEVPPGQVDAAYERVIDRLRRRVRVQGFRPGKAPRALVESRVGLDALREEVAEALIPPVVAQALEDNAINAIDRPQVEIQQLERGHPGRFIAHVSVMPTVRLPDLSTLEMERPRTEVDDELVERRLEAHLDRLAEVEPVEREVREGDIVVGDLKVFVDDQEVPDEARTAVELEVKDGVLLPELLTALPGANVGDVVTAEVAMPDDHRNPDLRGKQARLEVTVQGLKEKRLPELTDEVAAQLSDGEQQTVEALRTAVDKDLRDNARQSDLLAFEQQAVQAVVEAAEVEVPDALVDREVERQLENMDRRLKSQGLRLDRYLQYLGRSEQAYRAELRPEALGRVKIDLVLEELGKEHGIEPGDEEVRAYIRQEAEKDPELNESLDQFLESEAGRDYFRHRLARLRIVEMVTERLGGPAPAEGDDPGGPPPLKSEPEEVPTESSDATGQDEGA
jgi:trigger factor